MTQAKTERTPGKDAKKDAMKALRAERAQWVGPATAKAAEHKKAQKAIRACLALASRGRRSRGRGKAREGRGAG